LLCFVVLALVSAALAFYPKFFQAPDNV